MEFRLLGPLELRDGGRALPIGGLKQRALLAMLLLHANQSVPTEQLVKVLWSGQPPANPRRTLQFFVHRLRKQLADGTTGLTEGPLVRRGSGYMLLVEAGQLDADRFRGQLARARQAHRDGALQHAAEVLELALELWRGPALADFADAPFAQAEIARLEELRLGAVEEQMDVGLALGRHAALVGELEGLVRANPLREGFRTQHILALYRSGRQAEALEACREVRRAFVDELGIEPGADLRRLEQAILAQDPALELAGPAAPPTAPAAGERGRSGADEDGGRRREERKVVTMLVAGLVMSDLDELDPERLDAEDVAERVAAVQRCMTERVRHYGGVVLTTVSGQLLATFGAPRSREDDPERAVRAGLDICKDVDATAVGQKAQVGLATGEVIATLTSSPEAVPALGDGSPAPLLAPGESISVAGDVVAVATALQAGALPGAVVVGTGTYRATRHAIEYRWVPPVTEGGTQAWQAQGARSRTGAPVADVSPSLLVEREQELAIFGDLLERLQSNREQQLLTLVSVPGMGKSRLVSELGRLADDTKELINWRQGRSLPYGEPTAFWPLAEIVKAHAGTLETDRAGVTEDKLRRAVADAFGDPDEADQIMDQLNVLLRARPIAPLPRERQREVLAGWRRFLFAVAAERPLVVVFEDLQWADDALLDFIDGLTHHGDQVPLLVICTARPELLDRRPGWGGGKRNAMTVLLSPLSEQGATELLDSLLDGTPVSADIRDALIARSGGNPLYVEEYARMVHDRGLLDRRGDGAAGLRLGRRSRRDADDLPIPESVQQLIAARLDALPVEDKLLLQDAAVVGEFGWAGALVSMGGRKREQVEAGLHRLERRQLLRRARVASVGADTEYVFRHALVREVAYSQILRAEKAEKHRRVATWIQELNPGLQETRIELLAHHYEQALALRRAAGEPVGDLPARARPVLTEAGDLATMQGALATAAHFYRSAIQLWPSEEAPSSELLFQLGRSLVYTEHAGAEFLVRARERFRAEGRRDRAAEAEVELGQLAIMQGDAGRAEAHLERALDEPVGSAQAQLEIQLQQTIQLMLADEHAVAVETGRGVMQRAQDLGHLGLESSALGIIGQARICAGDLHGAEDMEQAIDLMQASHAPTVGLARFGLAWSLYWYGDFERCAAAVAAGRRHSVDAATDQWYDAVQAGMDYAGGDWDRALAVVDRALAGSADGLGFVRPWCRTLRGRIRLARGDVQGALQDATDAIDPAEALGPRHRFAAEALAGRALLAAGHRDEAAARLDELLGRQRERPEQFTATPDLADLIVDLDRAGDDLAEGLAPTRWHEAVRVFVKRDFRRAARRYARMGSAMEEGCARLRLAQQLRAAGQPEPARAELTKVVALLRSLGASAYLRYTQALLAELDGEPPA
ncbi:MAG TPA: BTAD domain-containing putative transcriptional regulator [Actinomycetes bacterium]|nr:BTAD domain-containing putative transcriptional regulator [Actinomycetes bacterium]